MNSKLILLLIISMVGCATQISSDIYIPSLLSITNELTGATFNLSQISISIFLFGVSFTHLIFGPLSEGIGRKKTVMIGFIIMSIGSIFV